MDLTVLEQIWPILVALMSGAIYGLIWWATQHIDPTKPTEDFHFSNLAVTLAYSAIVGVSMYLAGGPLNQTEMFIQLGANAALIASFQRIAEALYRKYIKPTP